MPVAGCLGLARWVCRYSTGYCCKIRANGNSADSRWLKILPIHFRAFKRFRKYLAKKTPPAVQRRAWLKLLARQRVAIAWPIDLPPLAPRGETEVIGEIMPLRRGLLPFQTLTVACPDPFGLVNRCQRLVLPQTVLILPKRYEIPQIELPGARRHQAGGLALAAAVGDSEEFRALREYRPGDPLRKIHWKSWAKTGRPIVKESQSEYSMRHALILDTFQADQDSEWITEEAAEVMEEAIAIAASFACALQTGGQAQESLLDTVFVGLQAHCFTIGRGFGHTEKLLTLLAAVQPCRDKSFDSLLPVVQAQMSRLSGCICILLDWDRDRQTLIKQLQAAGIPTLVLIVATAQGLNHGLTEPPDNSCLTVPESRLHVLQLGDIQKGLWNL